VLNDYHNNGKKIMMSFGGASETPTTSGVNPTTLANTLSNFVKTYGLVSDGGDDVERLFDRFLSLQDGIDIDYEDFPAVSAGTALSERVSTGLNRL
jgi:chitinase